MGELGGFGFGFFFWVLISGFIFLVGGGGLWEVVWKLGDDWCGALCSSEFI